MRKFSKLMAAATIALPFVIQPASAEQDTTPHQGGGLRSLVEGLKGMTGGLSRQVQERSARPGETTDRMGDTLEQTGKALDGVNRGGAGTDLGRAMGDMMRSLGKEADKAKQNPVPDNTSRTTIQEKDGITYTTRQEKQTTHQGSSDPCRKHAMDDYEGKLRDAFKDANTPEEMAAAIRRADEIRRQPITLCP